MTGKFHSNRQDAYKMSSKESVSVFFMRKSGSDVCIFILSTESLLSRNIYFWILENITNENSSLLLFVEGFCGTCEDCF